MDYFADSELGWVAQSVQFPVALDDAKQAQSL
jgi:hypothetical protein